MADRYWVGGAGTWTTSSTTVWSTSSGGSSGASVPTATDSVFFDTGSGVPGTVTLTGALTCLDINVSLVGWTFASTGTIAISGNMSLTALTTWTGTGTLTFNATTSKTITTSGTSFSCPMTFNGVAGTWTLQDALTTTALLTLTKGSFVLNGYDATCGSFNSNPFPTAPAARTIAFGTSGKKIIITAPGSYTLDFGNNSYTNLTMTGDVRFKLTYAGASTVSMSFADNWPMSAALNLSTSSCIGVEFNPAMTGIFESYGPFQNMDFTGFSGQWRHLNTAGVGGNITYSATMTVNSATQNLTLNGGGLYGTQSINFAGITFPKDVSVSTASTSVQLAANMTVGSTRTLTLTDGTINLNNYTLSTGLFSSSSSSARTLGFSSTGQLTLTGNAGTIWTTATPTNLSITGTMKVVSNYAGATGTRTITLGAIAEASTFDFFTGSGTGFSLGTAGTDTVSIGGSLKSLDLTGFVGTFANAARTLYGNWTNPASGFTVTAGTNATTFAATASKTITTNGKTLDFPVTFNGVAGTWTLQDALTVGSTQTTTLTAGTLGLSSYTLTTGIFNSNNATTRIIAFGTGNITATNASGNAIDISNGTNLTTTGTPIFVTTNATTAGLSLGTTAGYWTEANSLPVSIGASAGSAGIYITNTAALTLAGVYGNVILTGFTGTLANSIRTIYGNLTIPSGVTATAGGGTTTFAATSGTKTITTNGKTLDFPLTFNGIGGTFALGGALTIGSTRTLTLTGGALDITNLVCTSGLLVINTTNVTSVAFGTTGRFELTANNNNVIGLGTTTTSNFTYTGTSEIRLTYSGATGTRTLFGGVYAEASTLNIKVTAGSDIIRIDGSSGANSSYKNVDLTGFTGTLTVFRVLEVFGNLNLGGITSSGVSGGSGTIDLRATSGTKTITSNGVAALGVAVTFNGVGGTWQLQDALTVASTITTTLTNGTLDLQSYTFTTGIFASSGATARTLAFGTGKISLTGNNATICTIGVTSLTVSGTPVIEATYSGATGTRTITTGTATEAQSISFNITAGADIVSSGAVNRNLVLTGFAGTLSNIARTLYGNLTIPSGVTATAGTNTTTFSATSGTQTITTNAVTLDFPLTFNGVGGTFALGGALTVGSSRLTTLTNGTLSLAGYTFSTGTFSTATGTKNITFNAGTLTVTGSGATAFNNAAPTNFTTTAGTGTGYISMSSATAKTFVGGGSTFNCTLSQDGAGALTITGSNTLADIRNTTQPVTVSFTAATTTTFTSGFSLSGTAGNLVTIGSVTAASHTLSKASGTVDVSYCSISRSSATGGATWLAYV